MIKDIFVPFITAFCVVALLAALAASGYYLGRSVGIDKYHKMCYEIGGVVVDKKAKTVVACMKAGVIQEHELDTLDRD